MEIADSSGSAFNAGFAGLTLIEEHHERLFEIGLYRLYTRTARLLKETEDAEGVSRLRDCAQLVMNRLLGPQLTDKGFNLTRVVRAYEAKFIEQALEMTGGVVTRAAKLLGFKHHGSLTSLLQGRHKALARKRTPPAPRKAAVKSRRDMGECRARARLITILHVEDNKVIADAVKDTLELKGWRVSVCGNGVLALREIESETPYDLFLVDNDLPGPGGLGLVRRIRGLPHRRDTPVLMLSATECGGEAYKAGVDVFLRKPEGVRVLTETIERLLTR